MNKFFPPFFAVLLFAGAGCGSKKPNDPTTQDSLLNSDVQRYVSFEDADSFLGTWSTENHVIVHWTGEPLTLHPTNENNANRHYAAQYMHATLLTLNFETMQLEPDVAESLPEVSEDGLEYTYTIRKEAAWDDGSLVTAEDVVFTFKVNKCLLVANPFAKPYLEMIKAVDPHPEDDHKVIFRMSSKYVLNDYITTDFALIQRAFFDPDNVLGNYTFDQLVDPALADNAPKDLSDWANEYNGAKYGSVVENLNGLGAYKVESWDRGQTLVLVKKENHWTSKLSTPTRKQLAYPEKIYFKMIRDENALKLELQKQGVDVSTYITTKGLVDLKEDEGFKTNYHHDFVSFFNLALCNMNNRPDGVKHKKLFTDKKVRLAINHLTPVDDIIEVIYYGKAQRLTGPVPPMKKEYDESITPVPFDIDKAKQLLKEAGWEDTDGDNILDKVIDGEKVSFEFELVYQKAAAVTKEMADLMSEAMLKAGIKANPVGYDIITIIQMGQSHDFDMLFTAFSGSSAPDDFKQLWHTESWANKGSNFSGFGNAESDALIDSMRVELDETKRTAMSHRFQRMMYEEQPVVFVLSSYRKVAIHKRFGNAAAFYERPGVSINSLKLLYGGVIQQNTSVQ